ncbi:MAG: type II toxin-antitoxin system VapC family toxin [Acidimicrobiia bacterium]|nr:type II toxin-antitoxin system VapC family toxin [Acidimicrobiia bacterium]
MRLLLDTHVYLWWLLNSPRLHEAAAAAIAKPSTIVFVSAASVWEASIKSTLGRLDLGGVDLLEEIAANGFFELAVTGVHAWSAGRLPPLHRDPFDRLLVAQAHLEQLTLVTNDDALARYDVNVL